MTGANPRAAAAPAVQVGVTEVRAGLLPEDKIAAICDLRQQGCAALAVGDGVNDAPLLVSAEGGVLWAASARCLADWRSRRQFGPGARVGEGPTPSSAARSR